MLILNDRRRLREAQRRAVERAQSAETAPADDARHISHPLVELMDLHLSRTTDEVSV